MEIMLCWKRLFTTRAWHGYSFGRLQDNRDQYCEFFLCETLVRELNFKKSPAGPGGPRRFNGQNRTWSWGIFLDLSDVRGISREWLCDFYPCYFVAQVVPFNKAESWRSVAIFRTFSSTSSVITSWRSQVSPQNEQTALPKNVLLTLVEVSSW